MIGGIRMSEGNSQQVSAEEIERREREREAEDRLYKSILYFMTEEGYNEIIRNINLYKDYSINDHERQMRQVQEYILFHCRTLAIYLNTGNNYLQKYNFKDFFYMRYDESAERPRNNRAFEEFICFPKFLIELPENIIFVNAPLKKYPLYSGRVNFYEVIIERVLGRNGKYNVPYLIYWLVLKNYYKETNTFYTDNKEYFYKEILEKLKLNRSFVQMEACYLLHKHSPWYNKVSVFSYYSEDDLKMLSDVINNFHDNGRTLCKFFYYNRHVLSQNPRILAVAKKLCNNNYDDFMLFCKTFMKYPELLEIGRNENSNEHINREQLMTFINILLYHRFNFYFVSKKDIARNISLKVLEIVNNELNNYYKEDKPIILAYINKIACSYSGNLSSFIQSSGDFKNIVSELGTAIRTEREINYHLCSLATLQDIQLLSGYVGELWQSTKNDNDKNVKLYIFNQVSERLPSGTVKNIFTAVGSQEYEYEDENEFRKKIYKICQNIASQQKDIQNNKPEVMPGNPR